LLLRVEDFGYFRAGRTWTSDIPQAESEVELKLVLNLADPTQKATVLVMQAAQYVVMAEVTGTSINARQK